MFEQNEVRCSRLAGLEYWAYTMGGFKGAAKDASLYSCEVRTGRPSSPT